MARKLTQALLLFAVVGLLTGASFANQISLAEGTLGHVQFTGTTTDATAGFAGTCSKGSHCVAGLGLYGSQVGNYDIWMTGGTLALSNPVGDTYQVSGPAVVHFFFSLDLSDQVQGTLQLQQMTGGSTVAPEFIGNFTATSASGVFAGLFGIGVPNPADFTVSISKNHTVDQVYKVSGKTITGRVSSGELLATPEPTTLGLLGSGLLTMAGFLRRRLS
jgi:hypothetical protein